MNWMWLLHIKVQNTSYWITCCITRLALLHIQFFLININLCSLGLHYTWQIAQKREFINDNILPQLIFDPVNQDHILHLQRLKFCALDSMQKDNQIPGNGWPSDNLAHYSLTLYILLCKFRTFVVACQNIGTMVKVKNYFKDESPGRYHV